MKIYHFVFVVFCIIVIYFLGYSISNLPFKIILIVTLGVIFSILTLINLQTGLFLLIFVVPFTQQKEIGRLARSPVDIGTDDILIVFILLAWLANLARRKEPIFQKTSLNWPLIAFFSAAVFSFVGVGRRFGGDVVLLSFLHLFKFFEYVAIYFVVISAMNNFNQIKKFFSMFLILAGFIVAIHFGAMLKLGHFTLSGPSLEPEKINLLVRTMYAFGSNGVLGAYYGFFLCMLLAIILAARDLKRKIPLILFAIALSFALFNSYSRSAYLGLFVGFLIIALLKEKRFFLIMVGLALFSPIYLQTAVLERITLTVQGFDPTIIFDASAAIRFTIWKRAVAAFLKNPIWGTGYWTTHNVIHATAHSQYFAVLVETGIFGLSAFCWLFVRIFQNGVILLKKADTDFLKALGLGYIAGLSSVMTACFFAENLYAFQFLGPFWFITGLITSAGRLLAEKTGGVDMDSIT